MKKTVMVTLAVLLAVTFLSELTYAQSAQDVLEKMIGAMGGRKALEKIKDTTATGTIELAQFGMNGSLTQYFKEPNKLRMEIEVMGMVITQVFDGEKAWFTNPQTGGVEEMPESMTKDFARQAMGNGSILNPKNYGITYTLKPRETVEGKEYVVLEQKLADGHIITFYLDPETWLIYKQRTRAVNQAGAEVEAESYFSDYKKVGDTMAAHSIRVLQDGAEYVLITISNITYNTGLEDSFFTLAK